MATASGISVFLYLVWRLSPGAPLEQVRSETFTVLAACQWFNVLNCRSEVKSACNLGVLNSHWLLGGLILGNVMHFLVIDTEPMNTLFHTVPIPLTEFLLIGAVASLVPWAEEIRTFFARRHIRHHLNPASP
jgi:Ca2+-transporting ATPase